MLVERICVLHEWCVDSLHKLEVNLAYRIRRIILPPNSMSTASIRKAPAGFPMVLYLN